jgi:hypothetical protein
VLDLNETLLTERGIRPDIQSDFENRRLWVKVNKVKQRRVATAMQKPKQHSQARIVKDGPLASLSGFLDHTHTDTR